MQKKTKKIKLPSEVVYFMGIVLLALAVAMLTAADFGVSMVVAPAYLLSLKVDFLTFGQAEYVVQAIVFILLCVILKKFKPIYLFSFMTCLIYGAVLDLWRLLPAFNPAITPPGSNPMWQRIVMFIIGVILTSFSVALFYKTYLYPQVYDFFVKAVAEKYNLKVYIFKTCGDIAMLILSGCLTFWFFGEIKGINFGTLIMAFVNGAIIGFFSKIFDKYFEFSPIFKKLAGIFDT